MYKNKIVFNLSKFLKDKPTDSSRHHSAVTRLRASSRVGMVSRARTQQQHYRVVVREIDHIRDAFRPDTEANHKAVLRDVENWLQTHAKEVNISEKAVRLGDIIEMTPTVIQRYVEHRRLHPRGKLHNKGSTRTTCKWSTTRQIFNALMAALRDAERLHSRLRLVKRGTEISRIERSLNLKVQAEAVDFPRPATSKELWTACAWLENGGEKFALEARMCLMLWWFTCARPGDALLLRWENVVSMGRVGLHTVTAVKFVEGKGATFRGPYTVHTVLPAACDLKKLGRQGMYIFSELTRSEIGKLALRALKFAHPENEMRSVRRGSLQELAMAGTPEDVLMNFSGHACVKTLHRYLDWGLYRGDAMAQGAAAVVSTWLDPMGARGRCLPFVGAKWPWKNGNASDAGAESRDC